LQPMFHFLLRTIPRPLLIRLSYLFNKVAPLLLKGDKVQCPVCEKRYSRFLPYGYSGKARRKNALCPNCLSLERHRLLWLYLKNETDFFTAPHKVLHIAPEQCFFHRFRAMKNLDYTTGDLYSPLADIKFDLHDIPFEADAFDVIFCNHVLEHVQDARRCMRELNRVLKPGGLAIMQVPIDYSRTETYEDFSITDPRQREEHFWQKDHLRLFGMDYRAWLEEAGFKVKPVKYSAVIGREKTELYRLQEEEILFVTTK
jgi:hypothetical protein